MYDILYDSQPPGKKTDRKKLSNTVGKTLSRLRKNGLINYKDKEWSISQTGEEFLNTQKSKIKHFFPEQKVSKIDKTRKQMIVIFDIPEKQRKYRDWLRIELVKFGFEQIQKSVWFGPTLPKTFLEYLEEIQTLKYLRFFKATEKDLI